MQKIQASVQVECAGKDPDEILVRVQVRMQ